jgi:O-antigen/teichoic acid export membrane protein
MESVSPAPAVGAEHAQTRGTNRYRRAAATSIVSAVGLGASVLTTLVTVPILLKYLGPAPYGVWLTIAGAAAWLGLVQIGLGPSLLNQLAAATGREDTALARRLVSTAWWYQVAISVVLAALVSVLFAAIPWARVLNTDASIAEAGRIAATVVAVGIVLSLPANIPVAAFRALQEGYIASAWDVARNITRLVAVLAVVHLDAGMAGLAIAWVGPQLAIGALAAAHLFLIRHPTLRPSLWNVDWGTARALLGLGLSFSGISIAGLVISYTDNIVIIQVLDPASVPHYAITFAVVQLVVALEMSILDAAWPAYAEAASRRDVEWLASAHRRFTRLVVAIAALFAIALLVIGHAAVRWWAGPDGEPPDTLIVVFAALVVVQSVLLAYGRLLTALGGVSANMRLGLLNAAINLPLSIVFARAFGLSGVALGTLVGYLAVGALLIRRTRQELATLTRDVTLDAHAETAPSG